MADRAARGLYDPQVTSSTTRFIVEGSALTADQEREAAARLHAGAVIIYPTDTLYAVGCRALDADAVARLRAAKGREADKPLPVIVADIEQARSLASLWPDSAQRLAKAFWPGPLTLVVPATPDVPAALLAGARNIAVRVPASDVARALAREAGPLVSTSANLAGEPPCLTVELALQAFPAAVLVIDVGALDGAPSTIVDVTDSNGAVTVLREGRIARERIKSVAADRSRP